MKAPHLMTSQERQDLRVQWMENAAFMSKLYSDIGREDLAAGWERERKRLKESVERNAPRLT